MSDELGGRITQLHERLPSPSRPADEVKASVLEGHVRRVRNRRVRSAALIAASCVVGLGGIAWVASAADEDQGTIRTDQLNVADTEPTSTEESPAPVMEAVATTAPGEVGEQPGPSPWLRSLAEPPLEDRVGELVVVADSSLFVWGGSVPNHLDGSEPPFNDGSILDLEDGTWWPVAAAPLPGGSSYGVWTGTEVVVSSAGLIAAYDPAEDSWRALEPPSQLSSESQPLAVVGEELVLPFEGLAWDSTDDLWRTLAEAPRTVSNPQIDSYEGDLIVSGAPIESLTGTVAFRYDLEMDSWVELPPPGSQVYEGSATGVVENDLVVVSWLTMQASAMDIDSLQWRELPTFPQLAVKCFAELEPANDSIAVVSMCGQHAALEPGAEQWVAFDPPTQSDTFSLHPVNGGLLIEGSVLGTDGDDWISSPQLGPVTAGGATVDRRVEPEASREAAAGTGFGGEGTLSVQMRAIDCVLDVRVGDAVEQQTVRSAVEQSQSGPDTVQFLNQTSRYSLSCPSPAAYSEAFDALTVTGERGEPRNAPDLFDPPLPVTDTPEEMVNAVAEFFEAQQEALNRQPLIGLTGPSGDPVTFLVDVYNDNGQSSGNTYTIALEPTEDGWVIAEVSVQTICTRSASDGFLDPTCT